MATTGGSGSSPSGGRASGPPGVDDVSELSYSSAGAELDSIIEEFESGVIDVDRLVDQLERATDIVDELDRRLRRTRMRVEELVPRLEAIGQTDGQTDVAAGRDDDREVEVGIIEETEILEDGETPPGLF